MSESASGEASSATQDGGKEFSCPTCEQIFTSRAGVNIHHYQVHNESIAKTESKCDYCDGAYTHYKSNKQSRFCCDECRAKHSGENYSGKNSPVWVNRTSIECDNCGEEFEVRETIKEDRRYCSRKCRSSHMEEQLIGQDHPRWVENTLNFECEYCGSEYEKHESLADRTRFCSTDCMADWQSENRGGEKSPSWKGGYGNYYGENWNTQRQKARKRDGFECQDCGVKESQLERELAVHHIRPLRKFESFEEANELNNLVSFCRSCHRKWEGIPLRPQ